MLKRMSAVMGARPGTFGWSHTQAEVQEALREVQANMDDEEPNYYDQVVQESEEKLMLEANMSRKTLYKRPSKFQREQDHRKSMNLRKSIAQSLFLARGQVEVPPEEPEENSEEREAMKLETKTREGLKALYHQQMNVGKGIGRSPYIVPYRCLGTPDVKRDDSLLPKSFQFAKREKFRSAQPIEECSAIGHEPMVLPVALRAAYWNGGRWCGTTATASQVSVDSGYKSLYREVVQSEHRLVNCK